MIQAITVTNFKNESLRMVLTDPFESGIAVKNVEGIGGGTASINSTDMAVGDGAFFNSARANVRNIVLTLKPMRVPSVEVNRHKLYKLFQIKKKVTLLFETDTRLSTISGYVESNEPVIFSNDEDIQISIICLDPFFYSEYGSTTIFSGVRPLFEFPFSDDSLTPKDPKTPYNSNILQNWDFIHNPDNYSNVNNKNFFKVSDLRVFSGGVPTAFKQDGWWTTNIPSGTGTALLTSDGMLVNKPQNDPGGTYTFFVYDIPAVFLKNKATYTVSFMTKEYGLVKATGVLDTADKAQNLYAITHFAEGGITLYSKMVAVTNTVQAGIQLLSGYHVTLLEAKFEEGSDSTLVGTIPNTSWSAKGVTLRNWYIWLGVTGNCQVALRDDGIHLVDYPQNTEDFQWGQEVYVDRGKKVTMSCLLGDGNIRKQTITIPSAGIYRGPQLEIDEGYAMAIDMDDGDNSIAKLYFFHTKGTVTDNSDILILKGVKLEYGEDCTIAKDSELLLPPNEYIGGTATLEFGEILRDTRAILSYEGDADTGVTITIHCTGPATNITIENINTGEFMYIDTEKLGKITSKVLEDGDDIIINTKRGSRSIQHHRSGVYTNVLGAIGKDSDWFQLTPGDNLFRFHADFGEENLMVSFDYQVAYGGV